MTQDLAIAPQTDIVLADVEHWVSTHATLLPGSPGAFDPARDHLVTTGRMGAPSSSLELFQVLRDLADVGPGDRSSHALVAVFGGAAPSSEDSFRDRLWLTLQHLSDFDDAWTDETPADADGASYSFTMGRVVWNVEGLHPRSPDLDRWAPWPVLVLTLASTPA
ncbi:MAG: YqcI/YcgG family protein [Knoellia sp.]